MVIQELSNDNDAKVITTLPSGSVTSLEVLGTALSNIAPAVTAGITISLVAAVAGTATAMVYVIVGILMLILAAQIATLSYYAPSAGGMYSYVSKTLHPYFGFLIAVTALLIVPFSVGTVPLLAGNFFVSGVDSLLDIRIAPWCGAAASLIITLIAWFLSRKGVIISTKYGLISELISILAFLFIGIMVIIQHDQFDRLQFSTSLGSISVIGPAFIFAIFSYGGFESAGNLALESRNKRKIAPLMMLVSVLFSILFFTFLSYVIILGFNNNTTLLASTVSPFNYIGNKIGTPWIGPVTDFAMALALFSGSIAAVNTVSRTLYSMGVHKILPNSFAHIHAVHRTPSFATNIALLIMLPVTVLVIVAHLSLLSIMGAVEGVTSLTMSIAYLFCSIAVPVILWRKRIIGFAFLLNIVLTVFIIIPVLCFIFYKTVIPLPKGPAGYFMLLFAIVILVSSLIYIGGRKSSYIERISSGFGQ